MIPKKRTDLPSESFLKGQTQALAKWPDGSVKWLLLDSQIDLKRLYYGAGLAATCRGTGTGVPEYYRTRPMGHYGNSLFNAAMAARP